MSFMEDSSLCDMTFSLQQEKQKGKLYKSSMPDRYAFAKVRAAKKHLNSSRTFGVTSPQRSPRGPCRKLPPITLESTLVGQPACGIDTHGAERMTARDKTDEQHPLRVGCERSMAPRATMFNKIPNSTAQDLTGKHPGLWRAGESHLTTRHAMKATLLREGFNVQ